MLNLENYQKGLIVAGLSIFFFLCGYCFLPTIAWGFGGIFFFGAILTAIVFVVNENLGVGCLFGYALLLIISFFSSTEMGRVEEFRDLIGKKNPGVFSQDVEQMDHTQIRFVDEETAQRIGEKLMGEDPALGSRAKLAKMHVQRINGRMWWVAPILHSGFWKWWNHSEGTPGYIKVSYTNQNEYEFVHEVGGKDIKIKYQTEAYFGDDLERHLWLNGYKSKGLEDFSFEIDDNGNPWWVVTVYKNRIGFTGSDAVGVVIVDPQTGSIEYQDIKDTHDWVDRIQPDNFVYDQLVKWGEYQYPHWINLGDEAVLKPSHKMVFVNGVDGRGYWYTTISSKGKEGSISGFVMINTRTKEFNYYQVSGATEEAAVNSILGRIPEKKYNASTAIINNVGGRPTYIVSLKDAAGIVKAVGMADVENHSITGIGANVRDCIRDYMSSQNNTSNATLLDTNTVATKVEGTVFRKEVDVRNGTSIYYFMLSEVSGVKFVADSSISTDIITTKVDDKVTIGYRTNSETGDIQIASFENNTVPTNKGKVQLMIEANSQAVKDETVQKSAGKQADVDWDKLTPAEKAEMIRKSKQ